MADIELTCGQCGVRTVVSEYADPAAARCSACGVPLALPSEGAAKKTELRIRRIEPASKTSLSGGELAIDREARARAGAETEAILSDVHKARTKAQQTSRAWFWLAALAVGGLLIVWQYALARGAASKWPVSYEWVRSGLTLAGALAVLAVAFQDGTGQGLLCLLLPFYILYYAFVRMEYPVVRGFFLSICLALATETFFIKDRSLMQAAQAGADRFIASVGRLIQRAGEPPGLPPPRSRLKREKKTPAKRSNAPARPLWPAPWPPGGPS